MWVCHVTSRYIIVMLQLLCILPEQMIHIRAHYVCEVGQEKDRDGIWRWVLPYQHPCKCTSIRYGGMNTITPKRPFDPVYVDKPLVGDNFQEIIEHYHLDCIDPLFETCPKDFEIPTELDKPTGMVEYTTPPATDNSGYVSVMCEPPSGSDIHIGQTRITCEALDSSVNSAVCEFLVDVRDIEKPRIANCLKSYQTHTDPGDSTAVVTYQPPTATDNSGEEIVTCTPPSESEFAMGKTNVTCVVKDNSGNIAICEFTIDVKDEEEPLINACPEDVDMQTDPGNSTAVVTYQPPTASDNSDAVIVTCAPQSESPFAIGQTNVTCTAQDGSGNTASCEFMVDVKDKEEPLISACPEDFHMQTDYGNSTAVVTYQPPNATDNSGEVIVTCAPPSASSFAIGQTNITCTAQDGSGNTATCEFIVYVKDQVICRERLGVEDGRITDNQLTSSSEHFVYHGARNARLNRAVRYGMNCSTGAWVSDVKDYSQWIQASLGVQKWVAGVRLQGRQDCCQQGRRGQWVTKFKVEYSTSDVDNIWSYVQQANNQLVMTPRIFDGNNDQNSVVTRLFPALIKASLIRIRPTAWNGSISLRFELLGCELYQVDNISLARDTCQQPLGIENGTITNDQLMASSEYQPPYHGAHNARLNRAKQPGISSGAWIPQINKKNQWIQAALGVQKSVTGVLLQGREDCCQQQNPPGRGRWVTEFKVEYSEDGATWAYVQQLDNQGEMVFEGNTDQNSVVMRLFPSPVKASLIRIHPTAWIGSISLRFELLGCEELINCTTGWPVVNRAYVDGFGHSYTMVPPDKKLCSGQVMKWTYLAKRSLLFRAIVFRPIWGSYTQFQIVGINDIRPGAVNVSVEYSVPEAERIIVVEGDVIGWSFVDGVIAYDDGGTARIRYQGQHGGNLHAGLQERQTLDFNEVETRQYSIEATVQ